MMNRLGGIQHEPGILFLSQFIITIHHHASKHIAFIHTVHQDSRWKGEDMEAAAYVRLDRRRRSVHFSTERLGNWHKSA